MTFVARWIAEFWGFLIEGGAALVFGFALAGLIAAFVPGAWVSRQLGRRGFGSIAKASLVGVPMPLCSCSVIPTAAAIRRRGAGKGASAAFAVSTPEVDAPAVALTYGMLGPVLAVARPVAALVSALVTGALIDRFAEDDPDSEEQTGGAEDCSSCCGDSEEPRTESWPDRFVRAMRHGFWELPRDLAPWLVVGLGLSALIAAALPEGYLESWGGSGIAPKLVMLVVGVPFYVCAVASTPLAAALIMAGLSPGAALVFLLAGPATNPATMGWVWRDLGGRALAIYIGVISAVALGSGVLVDLVWENAARIGDGVHVHSAGSVVFGVVLAVVLGVGLVRGVVGRFGARETDCCAAEA